MDIKDIAVDAEGRFTMKVSTVLATDCDCQVCKEIRTGVVVAQLRGTVFADDAVAVLNFTDLYGTDD